MISDEERDRRLDAISFAKANLELEGVVISQEVLDAAARFANDEITEAEFLASAE